jgi:hypothetical protein
MDECDWQTQFEVWIPIEKVTRHFYFGFLYSLAVLTVLRINLTAIT